MSVSLVRQRGGPRWQKLTGPFAPVVDVSGIATSSSFVNGRLTVDCAAHVTTQDGYQESLLEYTCPFLTLFPNFDRETDTLSFMMDMLTTPSALSTAMGVCVGVVDSLTVATRVAAIMGWGQSTAAADLGHRVNANGVTAALNPSGAISHLWGDFTFGDDGTDAPSNIAIAGFTDDGRKMEATGGTPSVLRGTPEDWFVMVGVYHRTITSIVNESVLCDIYSYVKEGPPRPFP